MVLILVFGIKAIFHIKLDYVDRWVGKQNIRLKLLMVPPLASTGAKRGDSSHFYLFSKISSTLLLKFSKLEKKFTALKTLFTVKNDDDCKNLEKVKIGE